MRNIVKQKTNNNSKHQKISVLMTASTFPRWDGDTEPRFVLDLAKSMLPYCDVTVLAPSTPGANCKETLEGVSVIRYRYFPIRRWETLCYPGAIVPRIKEKKVRALLVPFLLGALFFKTLSLQKEYDVIHAHWLIPQGIIQSFVSKPFLVTGHGGDVASMNRGIMKKLKRRCIRRASAVTTVSEHLKDIICEIEPNAKVDILSMGCNTDMFGPEHRVNNYFGSDQKVVLFVGRLAEKKGVKYLIDAMQYVDAKLVVVGKGPLEKELRNQAKGLGDKVCFLGPKTHRELVEIYASADVFAAPSIKASDGDVEGFGLVFLEAMASGLPVVASASGGIVDVVENGKNGYLVPEKNVCELADKINKLLKDERLRDEFSKSAVQRAKQFDYSHIGKRYAEIIYRIYNSQK